MNKNKPNNNIIPPGFKILIIDNNRAFLEALAWSLGEIKIDVVTAESGQIAIEALKNDSFDLILLDLNMPGLNGVETFKKISKIKNRPFVLIMTAYSEDEHVEQLEILKRMNPYGILKKPLYLSDLMPFIKKRVEEGGKE